MANPYVIPVIDELDPVLAVNEPRNFSAKNGGQEITISDFPAQNPNNSSLSVPIQFPTDGALLTPSVVAYVRYRLTFTGDNSFPLVPILNIGATDAPRQWPFHQTCVTMDMMMSGTSFSTPVQRWFPIVSRMGTYGKEINTWSTTTPSKQDTFQEYYDAANPNQPTSPLNPLIDYNGSDTGSIGRGAHPIEVISNTGSGAEVVFTTVERLLCSPLFPNTGGITGVLNMTFNCTMNTLNRVWCHGVDPTRSQVTGLSVAIERFSIRCRFVTPKSDFPIPRSLIMPYVQYAPFATSPTTVASGGSATLTCTNQVLGSIPESIYIFVKRSDAESYTDPDCYLYTDSALRIDNLNIQFGNRSSLLANYSSQDLFRMSSRNGLNMTYPDWYGSSNAAGDTFGSGSFICIDVANDLGLKVGEAPGTMCNLNLTVQCTFTNFGSQPRNAQVTVITKNVGTAVMSSPKTPIVPSTNPITNEQVLRAAASPIKEIGTPEGEEELVGGKFNLMKTLGSVVRKGTRLAKKHKLVSRGITAAGGPAWASEGASLLGFGVQNARTGQPFTENYMGGARLF